VSVDPRQEMDTAQVRAISQRCGEFTMALVRTLSQAGTYNPDHPLVKQAAEELFHKFKELTAHAVEIAYVLTSTVDDRGILVEGLCPDPIEVAKTFKSLLGAHFINKFHEYFLRNKIASFSIKNAIELEEFEKFLVIWVSWGLRLDEEASGADSALALSDQLLENEIYHVTIVGLDEVVGGARHLNWAVKIALTRIRKDISRLPMLVGATPEYIQKVKIQAISDIVRPIARLDLLRDILLNLDLVSEGQIGSHEEDIFDVVLQAIPEASLNQLALELLDLIESYDQKAMKHRVVGREVLHFIDAVKQVLRQISLRLATFDSPEHRIVLVQCHLRGLIGFEELPPGAKRKITAGKSADRYIEFSDVYFEDFKNCESTETFEKYTTILAEVIPELLERGRVDLVTKLFEFFGCCVKEPKFQGLVTNMLSKLETGGVIDALIDAAEALPRESRGSLENAVAMFGKSVVPILISMLGADLSDVSSKRLASSILVKINEPAVRPLIDGLKSRRYLADSVRLMIQTLSEIGPEDGKPVYIEHMNHQNVKVREAALTALARFEGSDVEEALARVLQDDDETLSRRAIQLLGARNSVHPAFLDAILQTIKMRNRNEEEPSEALQGTALRALLDYSKTSLPESPPIEAELREIVAPVRLKQLLPGRLGVRPKPDSLVLIAIEALGVIGGQKSTATLVTLSQDSDKEKAEVAGKALHVLLRRQQGS